MQTLLVILAVAGLLLYGAAVAVMLIGIRRAPHGYEDDAGFHYGDDRRPKAPKRDEAAAQFWPPMHGAY